jgi:hypothetical protein
MRDEDSFEEMLTELARRREEFRELRYVPKDFIDRLKRLGLYRSSCGRSSASPP